MLGANVNKFLKVFSIIVLAFLLIVIYLGNKKMENDRLAMGVESRLSAIESEKIKQQQVSADLEKWTPKVGTPRSVIDDLHYLMTKNGSATISTLGSSVTAGVGASDVSRTWSSLILSNLRIIDGLRKVTLNSNGFGGHTSGAILFDKNYEIVISQKPDIVLIETCIINDHDQSTPVAQTLQNIEKIRQIISSALPNAKIIMLSPNPRLEDKKNNLGLTFADYANKTKELILGKGWEFIDVTSTYQGKTKELITSDGIHPNDNGYKLWADTVMNNFALKK